MLCSPFFGSSEAGVFGGGQSRSEQLFARLGGLGTVWHAEPRRGRSVPACCSELCGLGVESGSVGMRRDSASV